MYSRQVRLHCTADLTAVSLHCSIFSLLLEFVQCRQLLFCLFTCLAVHMEMLTCVA